MNEVHSPKKPLIFYYMVAMLLVMLFNFIAMPWLSQHQIQEVDYNTFVSMTEKGEIGRAEIQEADNRILFTSKDEKTIYKTAMISTDSQLVQRLLDAGVSTSGEEIEQTSLLMNILSWVAAHSDLHRPGAVHVPEADAENGRRQFHDVQYGQVQRQGVCEVRRGNSL